MTDVFDCFKAYDVRGRIPDQLNEDIARRIGKAYAEVIQPGTVVVGHDIRLTSESIKGALIEGLLEQGVSVVTYANQAGLQFQRFTLSKYFYCKCKQQHKPTSNTLTTN